MSTSSQPRVLIVGAGSIGVIFGYQLQHAEADVTFLVRPRNIERLSRPQKLFDYETNGLQQYDGYAVITDHADIAKGKFDFILITLDGASLKSDAGVELTKAIGAAVRGTDTKVIQGSMFVESQPWFERVSGLTQDQYTNAYYSTLAYPPAFVTLPAHGGIDAALRASADLAYLDKFEFSLMLGDNGMEVAKAFKEVYDASGIAKAQIVPAKDFAVYANAIFAMFAGLELIDWPKFNDIDPSNEIWLLSIEAMKEIRALSIHGEAGKKLAETTSATSVLEENIAMEQQVLPLDIQEFNRFHHGGKVNDQDRAILADCLAAGRAEGKDMPALTELVSRLEKQPA